MTVALIRPGEVERAWPSLWPLLRRVPDVREDVVRERIDTGHAQLWVVLRQGPPIAAVATQITLDPEKRLRLWLIGGSGLDGWAGEFLAVVEPWARAHGCLWIWGCGRRGWRRIVRRWGGASLETEQGPGWGRRI